MGVRASLKGIRFSSVEGSRELRLMKRTGRRPQAHGRYSTNITSHLDADCTHYKKYHVRFA